VAYERILVATDCPEDPLAALGSVKELARRLGAELLLLHVSEALQVVPGSGLAEDERERWQAELEAEARRLAAEGIRARPILSPGHPVADRILDAAAAEHADLIVVGTLGRTTLKEKLLGGIIEQIVRRSRTPVLVVPHPDAPIAA